MTGLVALQRQSTDLRALPPETQLGGKCRELIGIQQYIGDIYVKRNCQERNGIGDRFLQEVDARSPQQDRMNYARLSSPT